MVKRFLGHYTRGSGFYSELGTRNGGVALREPDNLDASRLVVVELSAESVAVQ